MDNSDEHYGAFFMVGVFIGVFFTMISILTYYEPMYSTEIKMAIEQCEQNLPRSQNCTYVISAEVERVN